MPDNKQPPGWLFNLYAETRGVPRQLAEGVHARIFVGDQAMLSVVNLEPMAEGKIHSHQEEQWGIMIEGQCIRIQGGQEVVVKAGDFWHTPGNVPHGVRTGSQGAIIIDVFSPPKAQYKKRGEGYE